MKGPPSPRQIGLADQACSSISNLALSVALAHVSGPDEFGSFGIAFAVYLAALSVGRGAVGQVETLRVSAMSGDEAREAVGAASAASVMVGSTVGVVVVAAGIPFGGTTGPMLCILGLLMPVLLLQDALRYAGFALHRPHVALANDLAWLVVQLVLFGILLLADWRDPAQLFAAWAAGSTAGVVAGVILLRAVPGWRRGLRWFRRFGSLIRSLLTEQAFLSGVAHGASLLVGVVSGAAAVGSLRAVQTAFGPVTAFNTGLSLAVTPRAARRWAEGDRAFHVPLRRNGVAVSALTLAWGVVLWLVPRQWGEVVLSDNWEAVRQLCLVTSLWLAFGFASAPAMSALRIIGRPWWSTSVRMTFAPVMIAAALVGASVDGALGATTALMVSSGLSAAVLWGLFARAYRRSDDRSVVAEPEQTPSPSDVELQPVRGGA